METHQRVYSDDIENYEIEEERKVYEELNLPSTSNFGDGGLYESYRISYFTNTILGISKSSYKTNIKYQIKVSCPGLQGGIKRIDGEIDLVVRNISGRKMNEVLKANSNLYSLSTPINEQENYDILVELSIDVNSQSLRKIPQIEKYILLISYINKNNIDFQESFNVKDKNSTMFCFISNGNFTSFKSFFGLNRYKNLIEPKNSFDINLFKQKQIPFFAVFMPKIYIPGVVKTDNFKRLEKENQFLKKIIKIQEKEISSYLQEIEMYKKAIQSEKAKYQTESNNLQLKNDNQIEKLKINNIENFQLLLNKRNRNPDDDKKELKDSK